MVVKKIRLPVNVYGRFTHETTKNWWSVLYCEGYEFPSAEAKPWLLYTVLGLYENDSANRVTATRGKWAQSCMCGSRKVVSEAGLSHDWALVAPLIYTYMQHYGSEGLRRKYQQVFLKGEINNLLKKSSLISLFATGIL